MGLNLTSAFKDIFKDANWIQKILIGGGFAFVSSVLSSLPDITEKLLKQGIGMTHSHSLVPVILLLSFICMLIAFFSIGYGLQYAHNILIDETNELPEWDSNYGSYFVKGFAFTVITFIYLFICSFIYSFIFFLLMGFLYGSLSVSAGQLIVVLLAIPFAILYLAPLLGMYCLYIRNFKFAESLNISKAIMIVFGNFSQVLVYGVFSIAVLIVMCLPLLLGIVTSIGVFVIPFISFYFALVYNNLLGQFARVAFSKENEF